MKPTKKKRVEAALVSLPFVRWDRFTSDEELCIYGWVDREGDAYKDFVVVGFDGWGRPSYYMTSSSKHSAEIGVLLWGDAEGHEDCKRVERFFDVPNSIKLEK